LLVADIVVLVMHGHKNIVYRFNICNSNFIWPTGWRTGKVPDWNLVFRVLELAQDSGYADCWFSCCY